MNYLTQIQIAPDGGFKGLGTSSLADPVPVGAEKVLSNFISASIGLMTIIAIIWFIFIFILGAIGIMSSGGDKGANETARKRITTGITGLVIVIIATFIIDLLGYLLGFSSGQGLGQFGVLDLAKMFYSLIPNFAE